MQYLVIKAGVRDGIIEARETENVTEEDSIQKIKCESCGKEYELDYPKCPYCGHSTTKLNL